MESRSKNVKIGLFIDGNYLLHTSNFYNYIHQQRRRLSIGGISKYIEKWTAIEENCTLNKCIVSETHYFRGRLNATDAAQRGNQLYNDRVFDDILMSEGVETHFLPLKSINGKKEERGIDVWLALEAYEIAMLKKLDYVALIVSDTDYVPLVRKLKSLGVKTILLTWDIDYLNELGENIIIKTSKELISNVSYPIDVYNLIENGLQNKTEFDINDLFVSQSLIKSCNIDLNDSRYDNNDDDELSEEVEIGEILSLKQGYGFVKYPNNNLFFHYQDVDGDFLKLNTNDAVEFVIRKNSDGQDVAKMIRKISNDTADETKKDESDNYVTSEQSDDFFNWDTV